MAKVTEAEKQIEQLELAVGNVALDLIKQASNLLSNDVASKALGPANIVRLQKYTEAYRNALESNGGNHKEAITTASQYYTDPDEAFDGWLAIGLGFQSQYLLTEGHLRLIRDTARIVCCTNDIAKAIVFLYQTYVVGDGVTTVVLPTDIGAIGDIEAYVDAKPEAEQLQLIDNWKNFCKRNDLPERLDEHVERILRDGEAIHHLGKEAEEVVAKFVDPSFITGEQKYRGRIVGGNACGVRTDEKNRESIVALLYNDGGGENEIKPENFVFDKRGSDKNITRGISAFYPVFARLRRIEKLMVNVSVLAQIQSAIALIRKHPQTSGVQLGNFVARRANGGFKNDAVTGVDVLAQKFPRGAVVDAKGFDYDFPAHSVATKNFLEVCHAELMHVAAVFLLPFKWLIGEELDAPLEPGSRVTKNFKRQQRLLYGNGEHTRGKLHEMWDKVQALNGVSPETLKKYRPEFYGPPIPVANALDEARIGEIEQRCGVLSPQTWASKLGRNWFIERIGQLKHRATKQEDEVMPGDAGNTNVTPDQKSAGQGGDGEKKNKAKPAKEVVRNRVIKVDRGSDGRVKEYQIKEVSGASDE